MDDVTGGQDEPKRPVVSRRRGLGKGLGAILPGPEAVDEPSRPDELTGLPNRAMLDERFDETMARCREDGAGLAVLVVAPGRVRRRERALWPQRRGHPAPRGSGAPVGVTTPLRHRGTVRRRRVRAGVPLCGVVGPRLSCGGADPRGPEPADDGRQGRGPAVGQHRRGGHLVERRPGRPAPARDAPG